MPRHTVISSRVLIVISTVVLALGLLLASSVQATPDVVGTADYTVRSGDSLWEIAVDYTADGHDIRDTIDTIRRLNDLRGSVIHPGQLLAVPVSAD